MSFMIKDKRAVFTFASRWVEYTFLTLIIIGFIISINLKSVLIIYIVAYLAGIHCGILTYYNIKKRLTFPMWFIIIGFLLGYLIGGYEANKLTIILLFVLGMINGHMLFKIDTSRAL